MKKHILLVLIYLIVSCLSAQQVQWAKKYPKLGEITSPQHIETYGASSLAVSGEYYTSYSIAGIFLYKMDTAGTILWGDSLKYQNPSYDGWQPPRVTGMSFNAAGKLFLGGNFSDTMNVNGTILPIYGPDNFFIAKYSISGGMDWVQAFSDATLHDIHSDESGNTFVMISFSGPIIIFGQTFTALDASDLLVLKLDAAGSLVWSKQLHGNVDGVKFKKVPSGNMFLLGSYTDTLYYDGIGYPSISPFNEYFLLKMDGSGNQIYYKSVWASQQQNAHDLAISADEKAMVTGATCWTNGCSAILKSYDAAGNLMADESIWGTTCDYGCGFDYNNITIADPLGVWAMGHEYNSLVYGDPNDDWVNIGLTKYDFAGNILMRDTFLLAPQYSDPSAKDIAADNFQNMYMTAQLYGSAQFGAYTLTNSGTEPEFFIVKFREQVATSTLVAESQDAVFEIYPNPAQNVIHINYECNKNECVRLNIRNVLGQIIYMDQTKDKSGNYKAKIDLTDQPKGVYFIEIDYGMAKEVKKIVLN